MTPNFSPERSDAMRLALEDTVTATPLLRRVSRQRWLPGAALLLIGLVTGGAVSAAAVTSLQRSEPSPGIEAPPGVTPGQPIISLLGSTTTVQVTGASTIDLPPAPSGATHLRIAFSCEKVDYITGDLTVGPDVTGNNPGTTCGEAGSTSDSAWFDVDLADTDGTLTVRMERGGLGSLSLQYLNYVPTAQGVNASGDTFGVEADGRVPDLIAASGVTPNGALVSGYVRATDLDAFGPDWPGQPSNPPQALEWQEQRDKLYPDGWEIPLYESDGRTQIGTFHVGGS